MPVPMQQDDMRIQLRPAVIHSRLRLAPTRPGRSGNPDVRTRRRGDAGEHRRHAQARHGYRLPWTRRRGAVQRRPMPDRRRLTPARHGMPAAGCEGDDDDGKHDSSRSRHTYETRMGDGSSNCLRYGSRLNRKLCRPYLESRSRVTSGARRPEARWPEGAAISA